MAFFLAEGGLFEKNKANPLKCFKKYEKTEEGFDKKKFMQYDCICVL